MALRGKNHEVSHTGGSLCWNVMRIYLAILLVIIAIPYAFIISFLPFPTRIRAQQAYYKLICLTLGIIIKTQNKPSFNRPILFISNHISFIDILVLGASIPGFFVSKSEVAKWPLFGWVASLSGTVFVNR